MKQLRPYQQKAINECWESLVKNDEPVLLMASVGSGKSLMISDILLSMQKSGKKALCIVNNAELVRNNCATFIEYGGKGSIYCAALESKDTSQSIIFGTPQSILNGVNKDEEISKIQFNLIIVDESHNINYFNDKSVFMRILRNYKQLYPEMRLLGATGTNFRFKGTEIVGPKSLFKSQVGNITTEYLISQGYLIEPSFQVDKELILDFSKVKFNRTGQFDSKQLDDIISKSTRLTELICKQIIHIMESKKRFGCFIFATSKKHAYEIFSHLPHDNSAIILGETPQNERTRILEEARRGNIQYIVNISIISVGVDIPPFDTVAYLRPTESLVLLIQTMGRALRLSKETNKRDALILDFAGNIERHRDWDNPILLEAVRKTLDKDKPLVILCPCCETLNTDSSRRCVGKNEERRCDYYFEFKECLKCNAKNDIASRNCHSCGEEIIDPNKKLSLDRIKSLTKEVDVLTAKYTVSGSDKFFKVDCLYHCIDKDGNEGKVKESFFPSSDNSLRFFYGAFVKPHCKESSKWYPYLKRKSKVEEMLQNIDTPSMIVIAKEKDKVKIKKKYFYEINKH